MSGASSESVPALRVERLSYRYGERLALDGFSLSVGTGETFGLLGPNGSGKTTLFRVLSTLFRPEPSQVWVWGVDLGADPDAVRGLMGVVFQQPALDGQLTVRENLTHHGHLYGLSGAKLAGRVDELLADFGLAGRGSDPAKNLSGGLQRRAEIAKSLLHRPGLLLMDEPSTGLDPGARLDLWAMLERLKREEGVTVVLTTHLLEEAERCDRIGIMDAGQLVALGTPAELRAEIGAEVLTLEGPDPAGLAAGLRDEHGLAAEVFGGGVRFEASGGAELLPRIMGRFGAMVSSATFARPTLADVFLHKTGRMLE